MRNAPPVSINGYPALQSAQFQLAGEVRKGGLEVFRSNRVAISFTHTASCMARPVLAVAAMPVQVMRRRNVQGRVPVEEAYGFQAESRVHYRHDGPVLGSGYVVMPEGVPDYQVGILNIAVGFSVCGETTSSGMLVGIVARGIHLTRDRRG